MTSLFQVLAADDSEVQARQRVASRISAKRVEEHFGGFLHGSKGDFQDRLNLIESDLTDLVTATCAEYDVDPKHVLTAIVDSYKPKTTSRTASVHEARKPKLCPYHKEVMDISLAQQEARAGFDAMAQHAWGSHHCQGSEYEGNKCNFKAEMTTQPYWDDKAEKREERREQREREQAEQPIEQEGTPEATEQTETEDFATDTAETPVEVSTDDADNVVEVDFGAQGEADTNAEVPMSMAASLKEAMSAKDFVLVADAISKSPVENKQALAEHFAGYLAQTNPNFDHERFIAAATGSAGGRDTFRGPGGPGPEGPLASSKARSSASKKAWALPEGNGVGPTEWVDKPTHGLRDHPSDTHPGQCPMCGHTPIEGDHCPTCGFDGKNPYGSIERDLAPGGSEWQREQEERRHGSTVRWSWGQDTGYGEDPHAGSNKVAEAKMCLECKGTGHDDWTNNAPKSHQPDCPHCHGEGSVESKTAEALKTVDVTEGGETPVPKIDKRKWTPENLEQRLKTEGEGSPHPTINVDILDKIDYSDDDRGAHTDAVLEKQDVTKNTEPTPQSQSWGGKQTDPVTSAIDATKNPVQEILDEEDNFLSQDQVRSAIAAYKS